MNVASTVLVAWIVEPKIRISWRSQRTS